MPPVWKMFVHQTDKMIVVLALDEVHELMNNQVLQASKRFLCKLQIQPDATGLVVAASPLGLHPLMPH